MNRNFLPKNEIVRNKKEIDDIFSSTTKLFSSTVVFHCLVKDCETQNEGLQNQVKALFVVPKKKLKKAVERNKIKRILREVWRHEKKNIETKSKIKMCIAIMYKPNFIVETKRIYDDVVCLIEKLNIMLAKGLDTYK